MITAKEKTWAVLNVLFVFLLAVLIFKYVNNYGQNYWQDFVLQVPFLAYYAVFILLIIIYLIKNVDLAVLGADTPLWPYQVGLVAAGFLPFVAIGISLNFIQWRTWPGAILVSLVVVLMGALTLWFYRKIGKDYEVKSTDRLILIFGVAIGMIAVIWMSSFISMLRSFMFAFFVSALVEEVLFRGYIQTRLNKVFQKPFKIMGVSFGWGMLIPALLFSIWHLVAPFNPFTGDLALAWPHALWTLFAGLLLGLVREKAENVVVPWLLHGVMNFF